MVAYVVADVDHDGRKDITYFMVRASLFTCIFSCWLLPVAMSALLLELSLFALCSRNLGCTATTDRASPACRIRSSSQVRSLNFRPLNQDRAGFDFNYNGLNSDLTGIAGGDYNGDGPKHGPWRRFSRALACAQDWMMSCSLGRLARTLCFAMSASTTADSLR